MIKLLFRPVQIDDVVYTGGGGSYTNLFDAHPPFQIDGKLQQLKVLSKAGQKCVLRYGEKALELATQIGKSYSFDGELR